MSPMAIAAETVRLQSGSLLGPDPSAPQRIPSQARSLGIAFDRNSL
jgi:hypothetical protein